jgi:hypothetical protein
MPALRGIYRLHMIVGWGGAGSHGEYMYLYSTYLSYIYTFFALVFSGQKFSIIGNSFCMVFFQISMSETGK